MIATAKKECSLILPAWEVRAILDGRKTQTRRVMRPQPEHVWGWGVKFDEHEFTAHVRYSGGHPPDPWVRCPYGAPPHRDCPGDRLWVRETWAEDGRGFTYRATNETWPHHWAPSIFMPRIASRITLEIVSIRVERLQDITEEDIRAEGIKVTPGHMYRPLGSKEPMQPYTHRQAFAALWDEMNKRRGYPWESNCYVWVVAFQPIDRR